MNNRVYLSLGSNLGDSLQQLHSALALLALHLGKKIKCSDYYLSEAVGFTSRYQFINCCAVFETEKSLLETLHITQSIEQQLGRKTKSDNLIYQDRNIDIDLLYFNNEIYDSAHLQIPHPRMYDRAFVLLPLMEIAPLFIDPVKQKAVKQLANEIDLSSCTNYQNPETKSY